MKFSVNHPIIFIMVGVIILAVLAQSFWFLIRALKRANELGMDKKKLKKTMVSSAIFTIAPAVAILVGVVSLSKSLGVALPWLRLSVIGALHYETQVAVAAAEATGLSGLNISEMTLEAFSTIALLMGLCIIWGMLLSIIFNKRYLGKLKSPKKEGASSGAGFGDTAMTAMFIGLVSAYLGSYLGKFVSAEGLFSFTGSWLPLAVAAISAAVMSVFVWLCEKKNMAWIESFSIAGSMIIAMAAAVLIG